MKCYNFIEDVNVMKRLVISTMLSILFKSFKALFIFTGKLKSI